MGFLACMLVSVLMLISRARNFPYTTNDRSRRRNLPGAYLLAHVPARGGSGLVFLPYLLFLPVPAYRYRCTIYYPAVNFRSVRRRHDREEPDPDNHSSVHRENSTHQDFSDKPRTHVGEHAPWARRPIINCAAELIRRKRPPSRRVAVFILFVCTALYHYLRVGHC